MCAMPSSTPADGPSSAPLPNQKTYGQILKSSAIIGGSSVAGIGLGIVRTKAMALILGPAGIGLMGLFGAISDLSRTIAEMGINGSGVRQIAVAAGEGDDRQVGRIARTLWWVSILLGSAGGLLLAAFSGPVSRVSFGTDARAGAVAVLGLAVLFATLNSGQTALIQGVRRISFLARANILGPLLGTLLSVPIVWAFGERGIPGALISIAVTTAVASYWYSRKLGIPRIRLRPAEVCTEASHLLKLGFAFMSGTLMTLGIGYLVRAMVLRGLGEAAAGYYQAAWTLASLYIGFILNAMGADFFPRLTSVVREPQTMNRLVNEQAEICLLLGGPGIAATITLAPLVIRFFYSASFAPAVELLSWMCFGMLFRICSWPVGFVLLAKGDRMRFVLTELFTHSTHGVLVWLCLRFWGLRGIGIAYLTVYVLYWILIQVIVGRSSAYRMSAPNARTTLAIVPAIGLIVAAGRLLPSWVAIAIGCILTIAVTAHSIRTLCHLVPPHRMPPVIAKVLRALHLLPA